MKTILAIDPGPTQSAWVHVAEDGFIYNFGLEPSWDLLDVVRDSTADVLAVEMIRNQGRGNVGASTFHTCVWVGRYYQQWLAVRKTPPLFVYRNEVTTHLCGRSSGDAQVRAALIERYTKPGIEPIGNKANPGPLYGVANDVWAALAVAHFTIDKLLPELFPTPIKKRRRIIAS